ncbi:L-ascorbate oxidase [Bradyrhizobium sp. USDA 326]|uniref:multicopper oxidase family protein n=1 Tax=Bradyrhizobium sp. USDA 326 TaxID=3377726 RepID=UPI003C75FFAE
MLFAASPCRIAILHVSARRMRGMLLLPASALLLCAPPGVEQRASAQSSERIVVAPPTALTQRPRTGTVPSPFFAGTVTAIGGEARIEFKIDYSNATIYNPETNKNDPVRLRSYRDLHETAAPAIPFVAPTIEVAPGETVRITLKNDLPSSDSNCPASMPDINVPHCFNRTNLHAHGLWVSPTGNSDNVLLSIAPSVSFEYEYNISLDHPAGTFWYHPHLHGSTALQVSSGMAGFLIVRGSRLPSAQTSGDVDTLLKGTDGLPFTERLVLLQQIQYACRDASGAVQETATGKYVCQPGQVGEIEGYDQFGPTTWPKSGRFTTINGQVAPVFTGAQVGRIERWRIAHAGVRDTVQLQFKKMRHGAPDFASLDPTQQLNWIEQNCIGARLPQFGFASDGLTRASISERDTTVLQPGYREDLLMVFPEAGDYCVLDDMAGPSGTVNATTKIRKFLARVNVAMGQAVGADAKAFLRAELMAAANRTMPETIRQKVRDDLANDMRLFSFVPHPDVADSEVKGRQTLQLKIDVSSGLKFLVDGKAYDATRIDRTLPLGSVEEWTLTSGTSPPVGHPFHIHVNPFQIVKILDPGGNDISSAGESNDPQYANLKGVWKDTLFVKPGYQVVIRTRYRRYIGDFVLHCHILDHEDQGMMQNVRIAVPNGAGGVVTNHH